MITTIAAWAVLVLVGGPIAAIILHAAWSFSASWVRDEGWGDFLGCLLPALAVLWGIPLALGWALCVVTS